MLSLNLKATKTMLVQWLQFWHLFLACNIVTPYVRNKVASKSQQYLCKQEAKEVRKTQIKENITMKNPLPASFKAFNNYNSFGNIKI